MTTMYLVIRQNYYWNSESVPESYPLAIFSTFEEASKFVDDMYNKPEPAEDRYLHHVKMLVKEFEYDEAARYYRIKRQCFKTITWHWRHGARNSIADVQREAYNEEAN